mgnify:CR=1 FL=1|tara:strand:+ start:384 stop:599 length:216 start_codon:yes stop_codon:yes gene_type:complete
MSILNYFFIGTGFTFIMDLLLNIEDIKTHPKVIGKPFDWWQRIMCVLIWPICVLLFLVHFILEIIKKIPKL